MDGLDDLLCFGGEQCWPPGFRFHPTDEELVLYYLKRKICRLRLKLDIIGETDVYKWDPEELPGQSKLKTGDRQWFFFSPRDRKYPNGARSNRATRHGYWKATGKDRIITYKSRAVGVKKTLVFYKGRAPTGERTDWVMHEYTLDEEELKRCQAAKDYYALYKLYKKSGPGPKNGEQYGAPFREEDWADGENPNVNDRADQETSVKQVNEAASVDNARATGELQAPLNDLDEFLNRLANEPMPIHVLSVDDGNSLQEVIGEEETQSTLVDQPPKEADLQEMNIGQQKDVQPSFELTQFATSQLQHYEAPEVTSAPEPNIYEQGPHHTEGNLLEDFIEINDLIGLETSIWHEEKPVEKTQFEEFDGINELDLFQNDAMFMQDIGPLNLDYDIANEMAPPFSGACLENIDYEVVNPVTQSYGDNSTTTMVDPISFPCSNNLGSEMVHQFEYQPQLHPNGVSQYGSQLWMHENNCNNVTPSAATLGPLHPGNSGLVCDGSSENLLTGVNQNENQSSEDRDKGGSWLSSALWALVDSIPTTPASASESTALVNKAFERVSSFGRISSRMMISAGNTSLSAVNPAATLRGRSSSWYDTRGFYVFSFLGVLCAVLWVLTGTSAGVLVRSLQL
ncbi:hypothetical protein NMG60_11016913 [Bertholletia excelsa]